MDLDSAVIIRYGDLQEGNHKGYNPSKRGWPSHHPLFAFLGNERMVVNSWLRSGDTSSAHQCVDFLNKTLSILHNKTVGLLCAETYCKTAKWENLQRVIVIRQSVDLSSKSTGKKLKLFDDKDYYQQYRYHTFYTNQKLPATQIWQQCKRRGDFENRIKELKYYFALEGINMKNFLQPRRLCGW